MTFEFLMSKLRPMVSVNGDPLQRLGAYMLEGLVARFSFSGSSICKALRCKEPAISELLSYVHLLYEACPYFKFGFLSANGAIAEAMKNESRIHIIDFQIAQGTQWITLIQALTARAGGPPHVRITWVDDSFSSYARGGGLEIVGQRLSRPVKSCVVPFEFDAVPVYILPQQRLMSLLHSVKFVFRISFNFVTTQFHDLALISPIILLIFGASPLNVALFLQFQITHRVHIHMVDAILSRFPIPRSSLCCSRFIHGST
ncbi:hypothetical protein ACS0TY_022569 [Phlomoides rotata]